jgi:hypothetical protein
LAGLVSWRLLDAEGGIIVQRRDGFWGKIEADFKGGVLTVTLPKTQEAQKKQIAIKMAWLFSAL